MFNLQDGEIFPTAREALDAWRHFAHSEPDQAPIKPRKPGKNAKQETIESYSKRIVEYDKAFQAYLDRSTQLAFDTRDAVNTLCAAMCTPTSSILTEEGLTFPAGFGIGGDSRSYTGPDYDTLKRGISAHYAVKVCGLLLSRVRKAALAERRGKALAEDKLCWRCLGAHGYYVQVWDDSYWQSCTVCEGSSVKSAVPLWYAYDRDWYVIEDHSDEFDDFLMYQLPYERILEFKDLLDETIAAAQLTLDCKAEVVKGRKVPVGTVGYVRKIIDGQWGETALLDIGPKDVWIATDNLERRD